MQGSIRIQHVSMKCVFPFLHSYTSALNSANIFVLSLKSRFNLDIFSEHDHIVCRNATKVGCCTIYVWQGIVYDFIEVDFLEMKMSNLRILSTKIPREFCQSTPSSNSSHSRRDLGFRKNVRHQVKKESTRWVLRRKCPKASTQQVA